MSEEFRKLNVKNTCFQYLVPEIKKNPKWEQHSIFFHFHIVLTVNHTHDMTFTHTLSGISQTRGQLPALPFTDHFTSSKLISTSCRFFRRTIWILTHHETVDITHQYNPCKWHSTGPSTQWQLLPMLLKCFYKYYLKLL